MSQESSFLLTDANCLGGMKVRGHPLFSSQVEEKVEGE